MRENKIKVANATLLDSVGTPLSTTQALLGHSLPEITREIYLHSIPADARGCPRASSRLRVIPVIPDSCEIAFTLEKIG